MVRALPVFSKGALAGSLSLSLRLLSLVGKLALSLFMGKFFALSELGTYGLAFGAVMLAIVLFGFRVDYIVSREIRGFGVSKRQRVGTQVALLYFASFLLAAPLALVALAAFGAEGEVGLLVLIYMLCGIEAYANFLYTVTIALKRPALANALFFVRSGLWTVPVMAVSYFHPEYRNVEFVLACWLVGVTLSVAANLWFMRATLIGKIAKNDLRLGDVLPFCRGAAMVWIGSVAITLGTYLDRFVLAAFLTLEDVGVATFYLSFTTAALTLVQSATTNVMFPVLIEHHDAGREDAFRTELRRMALIAAAVAVTILAALALAMPLLATLTGKPQFLAAYPVLLLLLAGTLVRVHAETLYYGLFVRRQHRAIWAGNLIFLGASLALNLALVWHWGLIGLGVSSILSAAVLLVWRARAMR